jgi:molybdopterin converting factor small subunit
MRVEVKLFSTLRSLKLDRPERVYGDTWQVERGATVLRVLALLGIDQHPSLLTLVNGHHASRERELQEGDTLYVFPALFGG